MSAIVLPLTRRVAVGQASHLVRMKRLPGLVRDLLDHLVPPRGAIEAASELPPEWFKYPPV